MKIIDAHAHIFPDKIAVKASYAIGDFYGVPMNSDASVKSLIAKEKEIDSLYTLVCSSALTPKQVESINTFIAESTQKHPKFIGFAAMHKDYENYKEELARAKDLGLRGVKFHNDMQQFDIDDPKMMPIYAEIEKLGMPVLFHMGDNRYDYSAPEKMVKIAKMFPGLTVIGAHFGGYRRWEESIRNPILPNVYYDTSSSLFMLDKLDTLRFIDCYGPDKFFFGSDFPMWRPKEELERFMSLGLDEESRDKILYKNFATLFGVDE
jgi:predicted TIM-barrel fold metal-dependent hydrolase